MNSFLLIGGLVLVGVLVAILYPLLKRQANGDADGPELRELNLHVLRDQLAELDRDFSEGKVSESAYQEDAVNHSGTVAGYVEAEC